MDTLVRFLRVGGVFAAFVGAWYVHLPVIFQVLFVFMAVDMVSGIFRAAQMGTLTSSVAYSGVMKKTGELLLVGLAVYMQQVLAPVEAVPLPEALALFYIYTEGLSVLENFAAIGVPIPDFLRNALAELAPNKLPPASGSVG